MNLGNALQCLGEREGGTARLEQAVAAYRAALKEMTRDSPPPSALAAARVPLEVGPDAEQPRQRPGRPGERERSTDLLTGAIVTIRNAHAVYVETGMNQCDDYFRGRLGEIEAAVAAIQGGYG